MSARAAASRRVVYFVVLTWGLAIVTGSLTLDPAAFVLPASVS